MKQKLNFLFVIAVGLLFLSSSCQKTNEPLVVNKTTSQVVKSKTLSDDELVEQAQRFYKLFSNNEMRSTSSVPKVKSVLRNFTTDRFRSITTSAMQNSGLAVVNFEDNKGFALMSESKHTEPLLGISFNGNITNETIKENPNLEPIISNSLAYVIGCSNYKPQCKVCGREIVDPSKLPPLPEVDPRIGAGMQRIICTATECGDPSFKYSRNLSIKTQKIYETIEKILPKTEVKWEQRNPYNLKVEEMEGEPYPVGCVPIAVGQIMSYYKQPKSIDWDRVISKGMKDEYVRNVVSNLLYELGTSDFLAVNYGIETSRAKSKYVPRTLRHYGYTTSELINYDIETIKSELRANRILYIRGYSIKKTSELDDLRTSAFEGISYKGGHAWIIDGFEVIKEGEISYIEDLSGVTPKRNMIGDIMPIDYVSCNFGWGGKGNGYYLSKVFNPFNKKPNTIVDIEGSIEEGVSKFYQYNFNLIKVDYEK